jgi:hypothetical protein
MTLTTKDKIALLVAILLGTAFGYFSILAGYGGTVIGGFYGILIVPLVVGTDGTFSRSLSASGAPSQRNPGSDLSQDPSNSGPRGIADADGSAAG